MSKAGWMLIIGALGLGGCTQTGAEVALSAAAQVDPTGIASELSYQAGEARQAQEDARTGMDFSQIAIPLEEVARGRTDRPNLMASIQQSMADKRNRLVARQAMGIARTVVGGAMSGGIGLAAAAPGLVMQAATTGMTMGMLSQAEAQVGAAMADAEAAQAAQRVVPDEDRASEAQALLGIADAPNGRSATWRNPATGASGKVTIKAGQNIEGDIRCRQVAQEWKRGAETRRSEMVICRQGGVWYDLS